MKGSEHFWKVDAYGRAVGTDSYLIRVSGQVREALDWYRDSFLRNKYEQHISYNVVIGELLELVEDADRLLEKIHDGIHF